MSDMPTGASFWFALVVNVVFWIFLIGFLVSTFVLPWLYFLLPQL